MKNITTILSELGFTVPEDKAADLNKAVAENYKTVAEYEKLNGKLTTMTERATTAENTLKGFEGKDFDAITRERDEWKTKHDELIATHQKEAEERDFNEALSAAISEAKGRNTKAIMANLDLEKLRGSKNRDKDIKNALDSLRTESGYLFEDNGGKAKFSAPSGNGGNPGGTITKKDIMSEKDPVKRQRLIGEHSHLFVKGE
ncbi:MAG: phage scaffolding protein [Oscillospiraceae bacterium]|nr:phage scaffolding protein [Oscillospiraceae bacterium]